MMCYRGLGLVRVLGDMPYTHKHRCHIHMHNLQLRKMYTHFRDRVQDLGQSLDIQKNPESTPHSPLCMRYYNLYVRAYHLPSQYMARSDLSEVTSTSYHHRHRGTPI